MSRGHFWEITFDPKASDPKVEKHIDNFENASGFEHSRFVLGTNSGKRINLREKTFSFCDCVGSLEKASLTNCAFIQCKFVGAHFERVKFTNCTFQACHFLHTDFKECRFIDCNFENISVAAEHFNITSTVVAAGAFLRAVVTNLTYLPDSTTADYQQSRLKQDKAKLAQMLYLSNSQVFGRHFFDAHKELILSSIIADIEEERFLKSHYRAVKPAGPQPRSFLAFHARTAISRVELVVVYAAGTLTDWGQSITKSLAFLFAVVAYFALGYHCWFQKGLLDALLRSLDVSLVAGYTAHIESGDSPALKSITLLNLVVGLYWYSLVVPVVTRKFLR